MENLAGSESLAHGQGRLVGDAEIVEAGAGAAGAAARGGRKQEEEQQQ